MASVSFVSNGTVSLANSKSGLSSVRPEGTVCTKTDQNNRKITFKYSAEIGLTARVFDKKNHLLVDVAIYPPTDFPPSADWKQWQQVISNKQPYVVGNGRGQSALWFGDRMSCCCGSVEPPDDLFEKALLPPVLESKTLSMASYTRGEETPKKDSPGLVPGVIKDKDDIPPLTLVPHSRQTEAVQATQRILKAITGELNLKQEGYKAFDDAIGASLQQLGKIGNDVSQPLSVLADLVSALAAGAGKSDHLPLGHKEGIAQLLLLYLMAVYAKRPDVYPSTKTAFEEKVKEALEIVGRSNRPETRLKLNLETVLFGIKNLKSAAPSPWTSAFGDFCAFVGATFDRKGGEALEALGRMAKTLLELKETNAQQEWFEDVMRYAVYAAPAATDIDVLNTLQRFIRSTTEVKGVLQRMTGNPHTVSAGVQALTDIIVNSSNEKIQWQAWEGIKDQPFTGLVDYLAFRNSYYNETNSTVKAMAARSMVIIARGFENAKSETAAAKIGKQAATQLLACRALERDPQVRQVIDNESELREIDALSVRIFPRCKTELQEEIGKAVEILRAELSIKELTAALKGIQENLAAFKVDIPILAVKDENPKVTEYVDTLARRCRAWLNEHKKSEKKAQSHPDERPHFIQYFNGDQYKLRWTAKDESVTVYLVTFTDKKITAGSRLLTDTTLEELAEKRRGLKDARYYLT